MTACRCSVTRRRMFRCQTPVKNSLEARPQRKWQPLIALPYLLGHWLAFSNESFMVNCCASATPVKNPWPQARPDHRISLSLLLPPVLHQDARSGKKKLDDIDFGQPSLSSRALLNSIHPISTWTLREAYLTKSAPDGRHSGDDEHQRQGNALRRRCARARRR